MADSQDLTHHKRQALRPGFRLFGLCLFVALTLAACGSDSDGEETIAGSDTDETSDDGDAQSPDSDSAESGSAEPDSTESSSTTSAEDSTTSASSSTSSTSSTNAPDTTAAEDPQATIDKSSVFTNPDETKPSVAPPTTVSDSGGDPLVSQVIGMSESAAIDLIRSTGRGVRVERRDGEEFMLTQDFEPDRLNLTVMNGSVTNVRLG